MSRYTSGSGNMATGLESSSNSRIKLKQLVLFDTLILISFFNTIINPSRQRLSDNTVDNVQNELSRESMNLDYHIKVKMETVQKPLVYITYFIFIWEVLSDLWIQLAELKDLINLKGLVGWSPAVFAFLSVKHYNNEVNQNDDLLFFFPISRSRKKYTLIVLYVGKYA